MSVKVSAPMPAPGSLQVLDPDLMPISSKLHYTKEQAEEELEDWVNYQHEGLGFFNSIVHGGIWADELASYCRIRQITKEEEKPMALEVTFPQARMKGTVAMDVRSVELQRTLFLRMRPDEARKIAKSLNELADEADGENHETATQQAKQEAPVQRQEMPPAS